MGDSTPIDIDREAPVVVRLERIMAAPAGRLWALHTDVEGWPSWQPDVRTAVLHGAFAPASTFEWTTEGLDEPVSSTIHAVDEGVQTLWGGPSMGITGEHRWSFTPHGEDTLVVTDESWAGAPVEADAARARKMLEQSLVRWLDALEAAAAGR